MATIASALSTPFTPAVGDFIAQASGGTVSLQRRNTAGAAWIEIASLSNDGVVVSNPILNAQYQFVGQGAGATPTVQADQ